MRRCDTGEWLAGRFRIEEHLGSGGFGHTYAATDEKTGERVAVKQLDLSRVDNWKSIDRFEREAEILERLDHPQIPDYIDFLSADADNAAHLVQQLAPGSTLESLLRAQGRFDEPRTRHIAEQLLEILVYLDSRRPPVIHRDIKPANLIADQDDRVYLVDFGSVADVAYAFEGEDAVAGTVGYMAPEMLRGSVTTGADLYSAGMTLIHLVSGTHPEERSTDESRIDVGTIVPELSDHFAQLLERMTEPDPDDRFASPQRALEFLRDSPRGSRSFENAELTSLAGDISPQHEQLQEQVHTYQLFDDTAGVTPRRRIHVTPLLRVLAVAAAVVVGFGVALPYLSGILEHLAFATPVLFFLGPAASMILAVVFPFWAVFCCWGPAEERRSEMATADIVAIDEYHDNEHIVFEFEGDGRRHRLRQPFAAFGPARRANFESNHPPGSQVPVRYDPEEPRNATVLPATTPTARLLGHSASGLLFSLPPLFAAYVYGLVLGDSFEAGPARDGGTSWTLGDEISVEPPFELGSTATAIWILGCLAVVAVTYVFELLQRRDGNNPTAP